MISIGSMAIVVYLLGRSGKEILLQLSRIDMGFMFAGLGLGALATLSGFLSFSRILSPMLDTPMSFGRLGHLHFTGQMLKHLPGRVFGIAYQIGAGNEASSSAWISANALHILLTLYTACIVSAGVLLWSRYPVTASLVVVLGVLGWFAVLRSPLLHRLAGKSSRLEGRFVGLARSLASSVARLEARDHLRIMGWMMLSWLVYFLAWAFYGLAVASMGAGDGILMCAHYNLAWIVGYITLVTPSGIGVREGAFMAMGGAFSPSELAYGVLVGRVSLLLIDLFLSLLFLPFHGTANEPG
nr:MULTISPECIES: lysylphosphatidylglycerol synthase domain-containing protein [unclassified Pseudoxanthomonas]